MIQHGVGQLEAFQFRTAVHAVGDFVGFKQLALIQESSRTAARRKHIGAEQDAVTVFDVKLPRFAHRIIVRLPGIVGECEIDKHIRVLVKNPRELGHARVALEHEKPVGKNERGLRMRLHDFHRVVLVFRKCRAVSLGIAWVAGVIADQGHALPPGFIELLVNLGNLTRENRAVRPQLEPDKALRFEGLNLIDTPPNADPWNRECAGDKQDAVIQFFLHIHHVVARNLPHARGAGIVAVVVFHPEKPRQRDADSAAPLVHRIDAFCILRLGIHVGVHVHARHCRCRENRLLFRRCGRGHCQHEA